jgi:hypothetical protein
VIGLFFYETPGNLTSDGDPRTYSTVTPSGRVRANGRTTKGDRMSVSDAQANTAADVEFEAAELEAALPTLTDKLKALQGELNEDERAVFSSIVNSAALHLERLQALSGGDSAEMAFKPISAVATTTVRDHLLELPHTLGLAGDFESSADDLKPADNA